MALLLYIMLIEMLAGGYASRRHDHGNTNPVFVGNMGRLAECELERLPYSGTLKYFMEGVNPEVLCKIRESMVDHLFRTKRVYGMRTEPHLTHGKRCFLVAIDGVHYYTSNRPIPHSTHRTHGDGRTEYMLCALEAVLVCPSGIRLPLMTEFIENAEKEYDKQDCELKAAKRLLQRLKKKYQNMSLVILMDGLYLCGDILELCQKAHWEYSITVTDHTRAFMRKADAALERSGNREVACDPKTGIRRTVEWANFVEHNFSAGGLEDGGEGKRKSKSAFKLNVIRMKTTNCRGEAEMLYYATSLPLHSKDKEALDVLDMICRSRWQIEELFDTEKNHGLKLEKAFGTRGYAGQNYYLLVQIAEIIRTVVIVRSNLFRRLQQMANGKEIKDTIQAPMLKWYGTLECLAECIRTSLAARPLNVLDDNVKRLVYDTA